MYGLQPYEACGFSRFADSVGLRIQGVNPSTTGFMLNSGLAASYLRSAGI